MHRKQYSILDLVTGTYSQPFSAVNQQDAIRMVASTVMDKTSNLRVHHADYQLFKVGDFDDQSGTFIPDHKLVIKVSQVVMAMQEENTDE